MADKFKPSVPEINEKFRTSRDAMPKDQLHAKRLKFAEDAIVAAAKSLRELIDDGPAKDRVFQRLLEVRHLVRKAVTKPAVDPLATPTRKTRLGGSEAKAGEPPAKALDALVPRTPATDPAPAYTEPHPSVPATEAQIDPPAAVPPDAL